MPSDLSSFKTDHHYVSGLVLMTVGLFGIAGSITGRLAAMMAGLFCNSNGTNTALESASSSSGSSSFASVKQQTTNVLNNPNATSAQKQAAVNNLAQAGANTPITGSGILSGIASKLGL